MFVSNRKQERRFLVIDAQQLILVEPDTKRLGWGLVRFVGFLQVRNLCHRYNVVSIDDNVNMDPYLS